MQSFDIYFLGETLADTDPAEVRQGVAKLFKVDEATVERMFSGKPVRVKQNVDTDKASRYRAAFRDIGALIQIVPAGAEPPSAKPAQKPEPTPVATTTPAFAATEASEEIVIVAPSHPVENDGGMTLAEPGATIDPQPAPPPRQIDTGELSALPANSGTLEDCVVDKPAYPIPDISHLKLVDD